MTVRGLLSVLALSVLASSVAVPLGAAPPASSAPAAVAQAASAPTIGLLAAEEPEITASLAAGARLALAAGERSTGVRLDLVVAASAREWSAASGPAVEMAFDDEVVALLTPPDRQTAHLLAQLGTRAHLPVVSTCEEPSVTATGSFWVVSVAPSESGGELTAGLRRAFRAAEGRDPDRWAVLGYDAAATVIAAVRSGGLERRALAGAWREGLVVDGASGRFTFDASGRRRPARQPSVAH
jgi:ABC-type branched-subunit amino acid transport system substrate-binding protein